MIIELLATCYSRCNSHNVCLSIPLPSSGASSNTIGKSERFLLRTWIHCTKHIHCYPSLPPLPSFRNILQELRVILLPQLFRLLLAIFPVSMYSGGISNCLSASLGWASFCKGLLVSIALIGIFDIVDDFLFIRYVLQALREAPAFTCRFDIEFRSKGWVA